MYGIKKLKKRPRHVEIEEPHTLSSSPSITRMIKKRRPRLAEHVAGMSLDGKCI
jgi:hypothetical protein